MMKRVRIGRTPGTGLAAAVALLLLAACATVSPDEMQQELDRVAAELREEFRQADQEVEERLGDRLSEFEGRMAALETELDQLREDFDVTVERLEGALRFNAPVHFAFDDATVRPQDQEVLERFAQVVREHYQGVTITVEGFTDPAGSPEYNRRLGLERAEAVLAFLEGQGLPADQMRAVSYGQDSERQVVPGAQGPGEEGWQNRRVAMVIDFHPDAQQRTPVTAEWNDG
jgi:peptidoglycan-associated lipoprotein